MPFNRVTAAVEHSNGRGGWKGELITLCRLRSGCAVRPILRVQRSQEEGAG